MNVEDFKSLQGVEEKDMLEVIFATQRSLIEKYHEIEIANGFHPHGISIPVELNDRHGQQHLKDMAWRVVEEIGEALEAVQTHEGVAHIHVQEELADGLHFLVELCIMAGMDYQKMQAYLAERSKHFLEDTFFEFSPITLMSNSAEFKQVDKKAPVEVVIRELGKAMNCLKNKPWKQTHQLTDIPRFNHQLYLSLCAYLTMMRDFGLDSRGIFDIYFRKSLVNKFRQSSQY